MAKKILQVIESAYRATVEEQDDTVVWITHAMKGAGADLAVLLRGHAVNYAIQGQDASGLYFGAWKQVHPPEPGQDIARLIEKSVPVYLIQEDALERGIQPSMLIGGVHIVARSKLPALFGQFDQIWQW